MPKIIRTISKGVIIQYREYQETAIDVAVSKLQKNTQPFILQMATGAGKSVVIAGICHELGVKTLVLQPSKEILEQNYNKLLSYVDENDIGIYSASMQSRRIRQFTFATIGSIYKTPELFKDIELVIVDECHLVDPKNINGMLKSFLDKVGCKKVIGLTATPYRIVQKYYTDEYGSLWYTAHLKMVNRIHPFFFKSIAYKIETGELINLGYLAPIKYFSSKVDTSKLVVNSTGADFTKESLEKFGGDTRIGQICRAILYADKNHKRSLTFCSSLRQANNVLKRLEGVLGGVTLIDGKTPKKEREASILAFKNGHSRHLLNVGVFTTGFDVPILDCIIMARPTMSLGLWYQMVGRGVRVDPDDPQKILHVYDLSGNVQKLGRVEKIKVQKEKGGFREEVWSERGRVDEEPLFKWFVKNNKFKKKG